MSDTTCSADVRHVDPTLRDVEVSNASVSDADLVARARNGDAEAFGELVDRHQVAVYRAARAALGTHEEAQDAAQDALLAAHRRLASFRGESSFKTWLLVIVWRRALSRRRSLAHRWRRFVTRLPSRGNGNGNGNGHAPEPVSGATTPEQGVLTSELRHAVSTEIRSLAPKLRDALLLAQSGEYTYEELGAMLHAPVGTIKWRVSEARRRIKTRLRARGFADVG
jgi:RNA polymerase sigma-70 factor (ECF subfamily)